MNHQRRSATPSWLLDLVDGLEAAQDAPGVEAALKRLCAEADFKYYTLSAHFGGAGGAFAYEITDIGPPEANARYNEHYWRIDPIFAASMRVPLPHGWDMTELRERIRVLDLKEADTYYEEVAEHYGGGVLLTQPDRGGVTTMLGLIQDDDRRFTESTHCREARVLAQAAMPWLHQALLRIADGPLFGHGLPSLTPRERECLNWVAVGKSSSEIGLILNIAERTVNQHLTNAMEKLGVSTRAHAAAKAVMLRLIQPF